ncbi:MAG: hypothetical protein JSS98_09885 [Bacteroidetes bacterium]|nr:hypothetical protein [Bacteroidota bacterium]
MSTFETVIIIFLLVLLLVVIWVLTELSTLKKNVEDKGTPDNGDIKKLRLQAYERITLLSERMSFQHLLSTIHSNGLTARNMQASLIEAIRQEYDYNISQQIYVSVEVWKAVNNLKEQNIYIVNQLAATLPPQATGMDLNKQLIDFLINNPKASLHEIVLEAINFEAKKLM